MKEHPTFTNYIVSENGEVINKKTGRALKPYTNRRGYEVVKLSKDKIGLNKRVNRLVLETYRPIENDNLYDAHHDNEVKDDNRLENLKWELKGDHTRHHHKGRVHTEETRRKLREARKGRVITEESKRKISETLRGHLVSEETRRKLREARKDRVVTKETKRKISDHYKGMLYWNNGVKNTRSKVCPGEGWVRGRLPNRRQS